MVPEFRYPVFEPYCTMKFFVLRLFLNLPLTYLALTCKSFFRVPFFTALAKVYFSFQTAIQEKRQPMSQRFLLSYHNLECIEHNAWKLSGSMAQADCLAQRKWAVSRQPFSTQPRVQPVRWHLAQSSPWDCLIASSRPSKLCPTILMLASQQTQSSWNQTSAPEAWLLIWFWYCCTGEINSWEVAWSPDAFFRRFCFLSGPPIMNFAAKSCFLDGERWCTLEMISFETKYGPNRSPRPW